MKNRQNSSSRASPDLHAGHRLICAESARATAHFT